MFNSNRLFGDDFENLWSSSVNCQAQDSLKDERSGGDILCFLCDLNDLLYAGNCTWGDNFPPIRYIFHLWRLTATTDIFLWKIEILGSTHWYILIMKHEFLVLRFKVLQPDFHGYFYSPKSDYKCDYTANIWFSDEQWVLSDTVRYIYNSNTAQNPGYYSYWHWIHNAAAATSELPSVLDDWIVLWCQYQSSTTTSS